MKALAEEDYLKNVKEVIGISAGTLFALIWILGYSIQQIEELALTLDFTLLRNITPEGIFNFPTLYGIDSGEGIDRLLNSVLRQKGFLPDATFEDIQKSCPVHFRCFATELQTSKLRQFGTLITPKVSVKFAVRASMALPFFYTPVTEIATGALLVDGGVLNNLPLVFLNANEMKDTWCVFFTCEPFKTPAPVTSFIQMFKMIFDSTLIMKSLPYIEKFKDHVIKIPTNMMKSMDFDSSVEFRRELIVNAYGITKQFLFTQISKPPRRFSAC
jgi:predicted acylesterase/phospholipase RssA